MELKSVIVMDTNKEIPSFRCPDENCNPEQVFNMTWEQFQRHQYFAHGDKKYNPEKNRSEFNE